MSPAVEGLETAVLNGELRVQKNPVMTMCSANAVLTRDPAGSRKFDKRPGKSTGRIDGIVALAMAVRCANGYAAPKDEYVTGRLVMA
jgi:phage terminase large subunit-like protein